MDVGVGDDESDLRTIGPIGDNADPVRGAKVGRGLKVVNQTVVRPGDDQTRRAIARLQRKLNGRNKAEDRAVGSADVPWIWCSGAAP